MSVDQPGFLRHIKACNSNVTEPLLPWVMDDSVVGWLRPELARRLSAFSELLRVDTDRVSLHPEFASFDARSDVLRTLASWLFEEGDLPTLMDEPYPVTGAGREAACCVIDRAAAAPFGVRAFGQHVNGFVRKDGQLYMWLGRRAQDRLIFPGYLDNMVAGGLPHGISMEENLLKEGMEEAAVPASIMRQARSVGAITYNRITERGLRPDTLYCYDLELSTGFVPQNTDGEVEEFLFLPVGEVVRLVRETDEFKLNCNLVLIDFFIRHGYIEPDDPEFLQIVVELRQPLGLQR